MSLSTLLAVLVASVPKDAVNNIPQVSASQSQVVNAFNAVLAIAGAVAVIFVILGGLRYATSQGNSDALRSAKEMIIYALVGLVVVAIAFGIVQIVIMVVSP